MQNLFEKIKEILFDPANTWQQIKDEEIEIKQFFISYIFILAAIGPVSRFIGYTIIGRAFGFKIPFFGGLLNLIISYAIESFAVLVYSFIMNQLADALDYKKDFKQHLKLIAYSITPYWILSVFYIIPPLSSISLIGGLYSIYLLFLGAKVLIDIPKEKIFIYIIILVIITIIINYAINFLSIGYFLTRR
ncbi:MAG: Yip1 family protein [Exilispira sp.]